MSELFFVCFFFSTYSGLELPDWILLSKSVTPLETPTAFKKHFTPNSTQLTTCTCSVPYHRPTINKSQSQHGCHRCSVPQVRRHRRRRCARYVLNKLSSTYQFVQLTASALFKHAQEHKYAIPAIVRRPIPPALSPVLTSSTERDFVLNRCCCPRSRPRQEIPDHSPSLPRWCCVLRWQGMPYQYGSKYHS